MLDILNEIKSSLVEAGIDNVYFGFENIDKVSIGSYIITIEPNKYESMTPVYSQHTIFIPFRAEFKVMLSDLERCRISQVHDNFEKKVLPIINGIPGLSIHLSDSIMKYNENMKCIVLIANMKVSGVQRVDWEELEENKNNSGAGSEKEENQVIYYNGKWLISSEIKAELDRLNCEIERLERENAVLRASATATEECETE